jgi:hypothetical protein
LRNSYRRYGLSAVYPAGPALLPSYPEDAVCNLITNPMLSYWKPDLVNKQPGCAGLMTEMKTVAEPAAVRLEGIERLLLSVPELHDCGDREMLTNEAPFHAADTPSHCTFRSHERTPSIFVASPTTRTSLTANQRMGRREMHLGEVRRTATIH